MICGGETNPLKFFCLKLLVLLEYFSVHPNFLLNKNEKNERYIIKKVVNILDRM